jgi:hypothetical protein
MRATNIFARTKHKKPRVETVEQSREEIRQIRDRLQFGSLGPASAVRRIDPKTGLVIEVIEPVGLSTTH